MMYSHRQPAPWLRSLLLGFLLGLACYLGAGKPWNLIPVTLAIIAAGAWYLCRSGTWLLPPYVRGVVLGQLAYVKFRHPYEPTVTLVLVMMIVMVPFALLGTLAGWLAHIAIPKKEH